MHRSIFISPQLVDVATEPRKARGNKTGHLVWLFHWNPKQLKLPVRCLSTLQSLPSYTKPQKLVIKSYSYLHIFSVLQASPVTLPNIIHRNPEKDDTQRPIASKRHKQILHVFTGNYIPKFTKKNPAHVQSDWQKKTYTEGSQQELNFIGKTCHIASAVILKFLGQRLADAQSTWELLYI